MAGGDRNTPDFGSASCLIGFSKGRIIFYEEGGSVDFHFGLQNIFWPPLLDPLKKRDPPQP